MIYLLKQNEHGVECQTFNNILISGYIPNLLQGMLLFKSRILLMDKFRSANQLNGICLP